MFAKCCEKRLFASSCLSARSSACPHKISLLPLRRDLTHYILAIFTKMYRPVLNYPIPCVERLDMTSQPRNAHKCKEITVCIVYLRTLTCIFLVKYSIYLPNSSFFLNRTKITDIYVVNSPYGTNRVVEETVDYLNIWRHIYASTSNKGII